MLNLMEGIIPEYSRKHIIRGPSGSSVTGIVPTNAYPTALPSAYVVIGANGESIYNRLMHAIGRPDLTGTLYDSNDKRVLRQAEIEEAIEEWTRKRSPDEVYEVMNGCGVPVGRIMDVKGLMENEHVRERGMVERIWVPMRGGEGEEGEGGSSEVDNRGKGWELDVHRVTPRLESDIPTRWAGPDIGQHNKEVLGGLLKLSDTRMKELKDKGVIGA